MKQSFISSIAFLLILLQPVSAGGPSSTVTITKLHKVEILADKIVIVGDIVCQTSIASEAREDRSVVMQTKKVTSGANQVRIEMIPYYSRADIAGACMGNATREMLLERHPDLWADNWKRNTEEAKKMVEGGTGSISLQGELISITGYEIKAIVGWTTLVAK